MWNRTAAQAKSLYRQFLRTTRHLEEKEAAHILSRIRSEFRVPNTPEGSYEALGLGAALLDNLQARCQHIQKLLKDSSFSAERLQAIKGSDSLKKWR